MANSSSEYRLIVPIGTQVVRVASKANAGSDARIGSAGVIEASPGDAQHAYRVRFADGAVISLSRGEFSILRNCFES